MPGKTRVTLKGRNTELQGRRRWLGRDGALERTASGAETAQRGGAYGQNGTDTRDPTMRSFQLSSSFSKLVNRSEWTQFRWPNFEHWPSVVHTCFASCSTQMPPEHAQSASPRSTHS